MKIIISPSKKMVDKVYLNYNQKPIFLKEAIKLVNVFNKLSEDEIKNIFQVNEKIAKETYNYYQSFSEEGITTALFAYDGIQYQYMKPNILEEDALNYLNDHLYIISGLYGLVRPFDNISLYRLEMGLKFSFLNFSSLYDYWKDKLADKLFCGEDVILDLASLEYSKPFYDYKKGKIIPVYFYEEINGKRIEKGVYAKMARGTMVKYLATNKIDSIEQVKNFNELGYIYDQNSPNNKLIFVRKGK